MLLKQHGSTAENSRGSDIAGFTAAGMSAPVLFARVFQRRMIIAAMPRK